MSLYLGNNLIAPNQSNAANKSLSNLDATGQAVIDGKADVDLSNVTDTANILMAHNAMPSQTSIDITLGASGATYTAPADGYYCLHVNWQQPYSNIVLSNGNVVGYSQTGTQGASGGLAYVPVAKGDVLTVTYHSVSLNWFRFTYAKGSESEAQ